MRDRDPHLRWFPGCFTRPTGDLDLQLSRRTDHVETWSPPYVCSLHSVASPRGFEIRPEPFGTPLTQEWPTPAGRADRAAPRQPRLRRDADPEYFAADGRSSSLSRTARRSRAAVAVSTGRPASCGAVVLPSYRGKGLGARSSSSEDAARSSATRIDRDRRRHRRRCTSRLRADPAGAVRGDPRASLEASTSGSDSAGGRRCRSLADARSSSPETSAGSGEELEEPLEPGRAVTIRPARRR